MAEKNELTSVPHRILEEAMKAGMSSDEKSRSGTFYLVDQSTIYSKVNEAFKGKVELMDTKVAFNEYPWLEDYLWKAVAKEKDEFTKRLLMQKRVEYFSKFLGGLKGKSRIFARPSLS